MKKSAAAKAASPPKAKPAAKESTDGVAKPVALALALDERHPVHFVAGEVKKSTTESTVNVGFFKIVSYKTGEPEADHAAVRWIRASEVHRLTGADLVPPSAAKTKTPAKAVPRKPPADVMKFHLFNRRDEEPEEYVTVSSACNFIRENSKVCVTAWKIKNIAATLTNVAHRIVHGVNDPAIVELTERRKWKIDDDVGDVTAPVPPSRSKKRKAGDGEDESEPEEPEATPPERVVKGKPKKKVSKEEEEEPSPPKKRKA